MSRITDIPAYVASPAFHQTFTCPRTGLTVSYADCGQPDGVPILFMLPSSNSRYICCLGDRYAAEKGVRLIAFERPGSGKTPRCATKDRMAVSTNIALSLLDHLHLTRVRILSHSSGVLYAVNFLRQHRDRCMDPPRLALISPWAPSNSISALGLIPAPLVASQHQILPRIMPALMMSGAAVSASGGAIGSAVTQIGRLFGASSAKKEDEGKYTAYLGRFFEDKDALGTAVFKGLTSEPSQGMSEDYLMCLSKGSAKGVEGAGRDWFVKTLAALPTPATEEERPRICVVWGDQDGLINEDSRRWLDTCFAPLRLFRYENKTLEGLGHDDPIFREQGLGWALDRLLL